MTPSCAYVSSNFHQIIAHIGLYLLYVFNKHFDFDFDVSDVNKDLTIKAKARTNYLNLKAKDRTKDLTSKAKARTQELTFKANDKTKDLTLKANARTKDLPYAHT